MKKFGFAACALLVVGFVGGGLFCGSSRYTNAQTITLGGPGSTTTWEYKVLGSPAAKDAEKEINRLGRERWELASVTFNPSTSETVFYFKRAKEAVDDGRTPRFEPK